MYKENIVVIILLLIILIYCMCSTNIDGFKNIINNRFNSNSFNSNSFNMNNLITLDVIDNQRNRDLVYDYLLTDGQLFYLYNSRDLIIEKKNPLIFETLDDANKYLNSTNTPSLNITNLIVKKNNEDPTENYERECAKKISPFNSRMNTCLAYSNTEEDIEKNKDLINDLSSGDHQLENCIIDAIGQENPDLTLENNNQKDIKFMDQFF